MVVASESAQARVVKADKWSRPLVGIGITLVVLFALGMGFARITGSETVETKPSSSDTATSQTTTTTKNAPSDTLLTAILATGAALIVAGVLYSRISTITLPGGVVIGLTTKEADTAKKAVSDHMGDKPKADIEKATAEVLDEVSHAKTRAGVLELTDQEVKQVVSAAIARLSG